MISSYCVVDADADFAGRPDADSAGSLDYIKFTSGYMFKMVSGANSCK